MFQAMKRTRGRGYSPKPAVVAVRCRFPVEVLEPAQRGEMALRARGRARPCGSPALGTNSGTNLRATQNKMEQEKAAARA